MVTVTGRMQGQASTKPQLTDPLRKYYARTNGGDKYSTPMLRARRFVFKRSFIKLYRSTRKHSVGPAERRMRRRVGAIGARVNASRCVTCNEGASVI